METLIRTKALLSQKSKMIHWEYKTDAIVLESFPVGEANASFALLTPEIGMIYAIAQGIRLEKSKLRFTLQQYAHCSIVLVYGKTGWRITNAVPIHNPSADATASGKIIIARVVSLIRRLVTGEEPHSDLYHVCVDAMNILATTNSHHVHSHIETVWVLRILYYLGYIDNNALVSPALAVDMKDIEKNIFSSEMSRDAIAQINRAIASSHL